MTTPEIDVTQTAEAIEAAANVLRKKADDLVRLADRMRAYKDLNVAADAINEIACLPQQCRIDLLVTRPLRALGQ